uniref:tRNA-dihydrouridine synthase n=1 Tax=Phallusia mammillata TaxID=59560 RepID=A0A6F9DAU8_9ASCI|nr:tRNA-dihydrouridine(20) synthase [NAD(P)+]-like [Phallusia mammillata]
MGFLNVLHIKLRQQTVVKLQACIRLLKKLEDICLSSPLQPAQSNLYEGKVILAPMVKLGRLPMRLLALKYGADLVYTDEIFSQQLKHCTRTKDDRLGLVNFTCGDFHLFQTCAAERKKVILQMGTNDPDEALEAAKLVQNDVLGIDVNFGCPTPNAELSQTGAFLLNRPDLVVQILRKLVNNLSVPVTCKIRVLPDIKETLELVRRIESTGVSALGVHGRLRVERRNVAVRVNEIKAITEAVSIPVIANGGSLEYINTFDDIIHFREKTNSLSVMVAQSAIKNTSVFRKNGVLPIHKVIQDYVTLVS